MLRARAHNWPAVEGGARGGRRLLLTALLLLGVSVTQASQAQDAAPAGGGVSDAGPIDTSISVQSSRPTRSPQNIDSAKVKTGIGTQMPHQQVFSNPRDSTAPNAVGFPVARPGPPQATFPGMIPGASQSPTALAKPSPATGLAGAGGSLGRPSAAISGTGLTPLGTGPGMVRGAPKTLGTVSGSVLHPKR